MSPSCEETVNSDEDVNSDEETAVERKGMLKLGVAYGVKFVTGVLLISLGAAATGYHNSRGIPYFLGAYLTGISMSLSQLSNVRNCSSVFRGNASKKEKQRYIRIETVMSLISVLTAIPGTVLAGVNGVREPNCYSYRSKYNDADCSNLKEPYKSATTYYLALAIMLVLLLSIVINTVFICLSGVFNRPKNKDNGTVTEPPGHQQRLVQTHNEIPVSGSGPTGLVMSTRHGQPEPFAGAFLSTNAQQPTAQGNFSNQIPAGFVLNTRHGQPQQFAGAVLATETQRPLVQGNYSYQIPVSADGSTGFVLGTRHGQPEPFAGAILSTNAQQPMVQDNFSNWIPVSDNSQAGFVLTTRHGQPQPFAGAVLSTNTQQPMLQGFSSLVSELQEQNRLLREQLALQQQQVEPPDRTVTPSAPLSESPPSYESCLTD